MTHDNDTEYPEPNTFISPKGHDQCRSIEDGPNEVIKANESEAIIDRKVEMDREKTFG